MSSPSTVSLNGEGTEQVDVNIIVSPSTLSFGQVEINQSSDQNVTITNSSSSTGSLSGSITITGSSYSIYSGGGSYSLSAGQSKTVTVRFSPTSTGSKSGTLSISHNATNVSSPSTVSLNGEGINPPQPSLDITEIMIDDDNSGGSSGNGDGVAQIGETIEVGIRVINNGPGSASGITATAIISSNDLPDLTIIDDSIPVSDLSDGQETVEYDFDFQINTMPPGDDIDLDIQLDFTYGVGLQGTSTIGSFSISVHPSIIQVQIESNQDAYINSDHPNDNYGSGNGLAIGIAQSSSAYSGINRALIDFPTQSIPADASIQQATLYVKSYDGTWRPFSFRIAWVNEDWSGSSVTWNNQPLATYYTAHTFSFPNSNAWHSYDVTSELQALLSEEIHEGLMLLASDESQFHWVTIWSVETNDNPYLEVIYTTTSRSVSENKIYLERTKVER